MYFSEVKLIISKFLIFEIDFIIIRKEENTK